MECSGSIHSPRMKELAILPGEWRKGFLRISALQSLAMLEVGFVVTTAFCAETNGKPKCLCPDNYSYLNQSVTHQGCKPNFPLPSCQDNGWETYYNERVDFKLYENTDWPLSDYDLQIGNGVKRQTCEQLCGKDCFCAAAIYNGDYCWKTNYPLSNERSACELNSESS